MPVDGASSDKSQSYSSPLELESSERQVKELIDSNLQTQQRSRLRAYEVAGITALTGGMMLVGALAGGPAVALAAGIGTLTIYTVFD